MRKLLLGVALLFPAIGCMSFRPVGLLDPNGDARNAMGPEGVNAVETAARVPQPGPPPPAPIQLVSAEDIDPDNPTLTVQKLAEEIEADRLAVERFPNYPQVSHVKVR